MLLLGHRGTPRTHTENTLPAFQNAFQQGLDGIELDVQPTRDHQMVLFHDEHLPDGRLLAALTWAELQQDFPHIPLLSSLLEWASGQPGFLLNIELKNDSNVTDGREKALLNVLRPFGMHQQVVISSFNPISLTRLYALDREYRLGFLYDGNTGLDWLAKVGLHLPLYSLHPHHAHLSEAMVQEAHQKGKKVFTWTVNDPGQVQQFRQWGVDGVIGDLPGVLKVQG